MDNEVGGDDAGGRLQLQADARRSQLRAGARPHRQCDRHICVAPTGTKSPLAGDAEKLATKAETTKALADVFAACDKVWASVTPSWNTDMVDLFGSKQTKMAAVAFNTSHLFEHYGNLVTYLRLKKLVPPSSQRGM